MVPDIWSEQIELFIILDYFLPFNSPSNRENQKFEKMKNIPGDIIILHVYHKCKSYDVWFLRYGAPKTESCLIWIIFYPFTSLTTQKIKILKKKLKNAWIYHHFTQVYHK